MQEHFIIHFINQEKITEEIIEDEVIDDFRSVIYLSLDETVKYANTLDRGNDTCHAYYIQHIILKDDDTYDNVNIVEILDACLAMEYNKD